MRDAIDFFLMDTHQVVGYKYDGQIYCCHNAQDGENDGKVVNYSAEESFFHGLKLNLRQYINLEQLPA